MNNLTLERRQKSTFQLKKVTFIEALDIEIFSISKSRVLYSMVVSDFRNFL